MNSSSLIITIFSLREERGCQRLSWLSSPSKEEMGAQGGAHGVSGV